MKHSVLFIFFLLVCVTISYAQEKGPRDGSSDTGPILISIHLTEGYVHYVSGEQVLKPDVADFPISQLDSLITGKDGYSHVEIQGVGNIMVKPETTIAFVHSESSDQPILYRIKLISGEIKIVLDQQGDKIQLATPTAMSVGSSSSMIVRVNTDGSTHFTGINGDNYITAAFSGVTQPLTRRNRITTDLQGQYFTIQQLGMREIQNALSEYEFPGRIRN